MSKIVKSYSPVILAVIILLTCVAPVSAIINVDVDECPFCWLPLTHTSTYKSDEIVIRTLSECLNTANPYSHRHGYYYYHRVYDCLACGYSVDIPYSEPYKETCSLSNWSR